MGSYVNNAFPAGDESEASDDEWDVWSCLNKKSPRKKDVDTVDTAVPQTEDNVSVLKRAISAGDVDMVERLLDSGLDVETPLGFEWTPLMCAVNVANYDLAKLLLDRGASANFSKDNWTVLMASCTASASEDNIARCVELLLSRNADPNMADRSQMTCLMLAAREGYSKVINLLVSNGAEINFQDNNGYTALSIAVQNGREEAVLKLLQLEADKTIRTKAGKSPADLAVIFKRTQITRILASSVHICTAQTFSSMEETLSQFFNTNSEAPPSTGSVPKLDEVELFLHGLGLGNLTDIMAENDITWSYLLTMEEDDLERIGIRDPEDQQKVLSAVQQMHLERVDLDTVGQLEVSDKGSEELQSFLISMRQQCFHLTETIQCVVKRFPSHASQLVFSLDPKKEAQTVCNQLVIQTKDLQKEVICLRNLLRQMNENEDSRPVGRRGSCRAWMMQCFSRVALSVLGASVLLLLFKAAAGKFPVPAFRSVS